MNYTLFSYDSSGKCKDCGLMGGHANSCHDDASRRLINQILDRMSSLYSYLSLVRHRHLPVGTDDHLIRDIDQALGNGSESLKEWWAERQAENQKKALEKK